MATILIIDDSPTNREFLVTLLGYVGHYLLEAADGVEGLETARSTKPDLVIADILMPTMDGFEFVRQLRAEPAIAATPVIFYSATYLQGEARALAEACDVHYILTKPTEPQVVLETVGAALGLSPPPSPAPPSPAETFDREHLRLLTDKLVEKVSELEKANQRLAALVEAGQQLALEHDPARLLENFCSAARDIIGARVAAIGILDDTGEELSWLYASGLDPQAAGRLGKSPADEGLFGLVLAEHRPHRLHGLNGAPATAGLPPDHPPVHSLLVVPVASPARAYGCLYLADKLGAEEFGDSDEQLAITLAAQMALAYENAARRDQLQRWNTELENVVKELESFSYSVAHDLRAPLRAVIGFATAMLEDFGAQLDAEGQRYLAVIRDNAQNMGQLIDDLLAFSRLGRQSMSTGNVNIATLAKSVFEELIQAEPGRTVKLKLGNLPLARGDQAMVRQVLANLLANAIKFTRRRKTAVIEVGGYEGKLENVYNVKDNGAGFDMRYADKLFGVFQRLHPTEEFEGTGIGLSIVRRVIQRHGGRVWAEGEVGRGATFYFTLPPGTKSDEQDGRD